MIQQQQPRVPPQWSDLKGNVSRKTDDEVHRKWHALFGDDCRRPACAVGKETRS